MIRINLLPTAKKGARAAASSGGSGSQVWALAYFMAVLVWMGALGAVYYSFSERLDEIADQNADLTRQIEQARAQSADLERVQADLAKSKQLEGVVDQLRRAQTGPTRVLREISQILSAGGGPTIDPARLEALRRDNPLAGFNPSWDGRRLWVTEFKEEQRQCEISGLGKTNEDVAEFLRRLSLSESFEEVTLTKTESKVDADTSLPFIEFSITCKVRY